MKRYPLGMPAWLFWVLAMLLAVALGSIPFVGPFLTIAVLIAALVFFFGFVKPEKDRRYRVFQPVPLVGEVDLGVDRLEVVGEASYLLSISQAVDAGGREMKAALLWEPRNPHASNGSAVRVDLVVDGRSFTCGYIPSGLSAQVVPIVRDNAKRGLLTVAPARVFGGTAEKRNYGVWLGSGVGRKSSKPRFSPS